MTAISQLSSESIPSNGGSTQPPGGGAPAVLRHYTLFLTIAVLILVKFGAMVTSTGSGMAYEDWPLANGSFWPADMKLDGFLEHGHRTVGAFIGLLVLGLVALVFRFEKRRGVRYAAIALLGAVVVQGLVGGVGILRGLPTVTSVTHGVLAQCILSGTAVVAFACSKAWTVVERAPAGRVATARKLSIVALGFIFAQLLMGALVRHTNNGSLLWLHVFSAIAVSLSIMLASSYSAGKLGSVVPGFRSAGNWIIALLLLQLTLGFVTLAVRSPKDPSNIEHLGRSFLVSGHVVVGASLFLMATVLCARTFRNVQPEVAA